MISMLAIGSIAFFLRFLLTKCVFLLERDRKRIWVTIIFELLKERI